MTHITFCGLLSALALFGVQPEAHAIKIKTYSLPELVASSQVIVLGRLKLEKGKPFVAVQEHLKGKSPDKLRVIYLSFRETDRPIFIDGEEVLLFLEKVDDSNGHLLGYGDQGKWPKLAGAWPFQRVHAVKVAQVKDATEQLLKLASDPDLEKQILILRNFLESDVPFNQMIGMEYLQMRNEQALAERFCKRIVALLQSDNHDVSQKAKFIKSVFKKE